MNSPVFSFIDIRIYITSLFCALIIFLPINIFAEGIYLNDGRIVYGRIVNQNDNTMQIRTNYGIIKLRKSDIKKINYDLGLGTVTVAMKNGSFINGTLISLTATKVTVKDDSIDHDIPRSEIESLVLHKFEGSRDNTFGFMGGVLKTTSSIKEQTPYGLVDVTAFYLRAITSLPFFTWGLSASYVKLKTEDSKTNLHDAEMTLNPLLIDFRVKYPLFALFSSSDWASGINFFVNTGIGFSYVTLKEGNDSRSDTYYTLQPGLGISISFGEHIYLVNQYDYLYIHQKELPYSGYRARFGIGYIF